MVGFPDSTTQVRGEIYKFFFNPIKLNPIMACGSGFYFSTGHSGGHGGHAGQNGSSTACGAGSRLAVIGLSPAALIKVDPSTKMAVIRTNSLTFFIVISRTDAAVWV